MNTKEALSILGFDSMPTRSQLKSRHRKLAKILHPDRSGDNKKFQALTKAYDFIKSRIERASNEEPEAWIPKQPRISKDHLNISIRLTVTFEESCVGSQKSIKYSKISSISGEQCQVCHGNTVMFSSGDLKICNVCENGSFAKHTNRNIRIPAGISHGQKLFFESEGHVHNGIKGSLIVHVNVKKEKFRSRDGLNVLEDVPVTYSCLMLEKKVIARTLHGDRRVKIPFGTFDGDTLRIKGQGVQVKGKSGDHLLKMCLIAPSSLSDDQKAALVALEKVGL